MLSQRFSPPAPSRHLSYIGGATNRAIVDQTEDQILAQVDRDVRQMLIKEDAPPAIKVGIRVWPRAIPQASSGRSALTQASCD